jgi:deoxyadenosine/deoxycytidine kinase
MTIKDNRPLVGIVGPCGSGKTTLISGLASHNIRTRHIAQEHSYVPYMWQRITNPDILIFLDASFAETIRRRRLNWTIEEYNEQHRRLSHARQHANLYIDTDPYTPEQITQLVLDFLNQTGYPA